METAVGTEISVTSIHSETLSFVQNPKVEEKKIEKKRGKKVRVKHGRIMIVCVSGILLCWAIFFSICVRSKGYINKMYKSV